MNKALLAALASVALVGASCSVQDFSTVVMDKPTITASLPDAVAVISDANGYLSTADTLGKFSFRYGVLSENRYDFDSYPLYPRATFLTTDGSLLPSDKHVTNVGFVPCSAGTTYSLYYSVLNYANVYFYDASYNFMTNYSALSSGASFSTPANTAYLKFEFRYVNTDDLPFGFDVSSMNVDLRLGTSAYDGYQPFAYGVSVDVPFLSAPRSFALPLDANQKPNGQFTYNGYLNDGAQWVFKYGYHYVDAAHPRTTQTCIGMTFVSEEQRSVFLERFTDLALPGREYSNCSYVDYELSAVDATDGHCGIYLYFRPVFPSNTLLESYMSFNTGSYDDGYTDGYDYGYMVGYQAQTYEIVKGIEEVSLSYIVGSGDDEEVRNVTRTNGEAFELLRNNCINGLLQLDAIYDELIPSSELDAHRLVLLLSYSDAKTVDAAPLYIDYKQLADPIPFAQQTELRVYTPVNLPIQRWNAFSGYLDVGYQGQLGNYPNLSYDERFRSYTRISVTYPTRNVGGALLYLGILSDYTRGYTDGVTSRDGEVEDLTERILGLEEDLSQYRGKTYQQIYDAGFQAGLDEENQGARTFNSLFGNILSAPLTILNGVSDISFFGMPILTAILSLLMVAFALFLFKRFK